MLSTLINIIAAPKQAFEHLRKAPSILFPLLLAVLFVSATTFAFFQLTDPDFLIDDLLNQAGTDMSDTERAEAKQGMQDMPSGALKWISTASGSVGLVLMILVHAGYYYLTSMFNGTKIGYKPWLSFVAWSNIPTLFSSIASLATLFFATGHLSLLELNPFTLANVFNVDTDNNALMSIINKLDLTRLWSIGLMLLGYQLWTKKSWLHCTGVVLLPMGAIFCVMIALS